MVSKVIYMEKTPADFQIIISTKDNEPEWDDFLCNHIGGSHYQSSMWGRCRILFGWKPIRILTEKDHQIVGGVQLLQCNLPIVGSIAFVPKGPMIAPGNEDVFFPLLEKILEVCRNRKIKFLTIRPPDNGFSMDQQLSQSGFFQSPFNVSLGATIKIDLAPDINEIYAKIKRNNRKHIERSKSAGVVIREGTKEDLSIFHNLYQVSAKRQGFTACPLEYLESIWQAFSPGEHIQLILASYNDETISGIINIAFCDTVTVKFTVWSGKYPEVYPNDAVWWEGIQWAKNHGYSQLDFDGINVDIAKKIVKGPPFSEDVTKSYCYRKYLFGGQVAFFPDSYDYIFNPWLKFCYKTFYYLVKKQPEKIEAIWKKLKKG